MGLRDHAGRGAAADVVRRTHPGAVLAGGTALAGGAAAAARRAADVPAPRRGARRVRATRGPAAAALRRRRPDVHRARRRGRGRRQRRRLPPVHLRRHGRARRGRWRARRRSAGPLRRGGARVGEAAAEPGRHLVHRAVGHLADGVARGRPGGARRGTRPGPASRRRHRRGHGALPRRDRGDDACRGQVDGRHHEHPDARPGRRRPTVDTVRPAPLRRRGDARRRPRDVVLRDALVRRRARRARHPAPAAERRPVPPRRRPRPGLLAGRAAHRAVRRGDGPRHHHHEAARVHDAAQAPQGGAAALVPPLRPARHARLAGRPERRSRLPHLGRDVARPLPDPARRPTRACGPGPLRPGRTSDLRERAATHPCSICATSLR